LLATVNCIIGTFLAADEWILQSCKNLVIDFLHHISLYQVAKYQACVSYIINCPHNCNLTDANKTAEHQFHNYTNIPKHKIKHTTPKAAEITQIQQRQIH